jgi:hypothetical protein
VSAGQTQYPQEILRDTGFAVLAVWLLVRPRTWLSLDGWLGWGREKTTGTGNSTGPADDYSTSIAEGK